MTWLGRNATTCVAAALLLAPAAFSAAYGQTVRSQGQSTGVPICDAVIAKWRSCMANPILEEVLIENSIAKWRRLGSEAADECQRRMKVICPR